jgi:KDO2-lipid IV(A) lauroyltransferase
MKTLAFRLLVAVFSLVPPRLSPMLAYPLAWLMWPLARRLRTVSLRNLALCYPEKSATEQRQLARQAMYHYARNALEAGVTWCWSQQRFDRLFLEPVGYEHFQRALDSGRGVVFLAPHYGAWEMLGLRMSGPLGATLYKPGPDPAIEQMLVQNRERFGAHLVPANRRGLKQLMDSLKRAEAVAVLPDQEPRLGDGRFAPFFGVPALTGVLAPRLLQRTGALAVFSVCVRRPGGRYQVHVLPASEEIYSEDLDTAIAAVNRGVEQCIALDPGQYLWAYKRFRARPEGQPRLY